VRRRRILSRRFIITGFAIFFVVMAAVFGISYYALNKLTFAGDRIIYGKKLSTLALEIRSELLKRSDVTEVSFTTEDNFKLAGLLFRRPRAQANVVICHGYKSIKELSYAFVDLFPEWNILLFDFRAHGQSEGSMTSIGCNEYKDVIAAAKFLKEQVNDGLQRPCIVLGVSMGGAASLKAAEQDPGLCDALIIDSSYTRLDSTVQKAFAVKSNLPQFPFYLIIRSMFEYFSHCSMDQMAPCEIVKNINQPIFFIHSCDDSYVSPKNTLRLYTNVKNKKSKLWIAPSCRHGWLHSYQSDTYKHKVIKFLKRTVQSFVA
jgi:uncharacterized protein